MTTTLPKEINYGQKLASLPANTTKTSIVVMPSNGQTFAAGGNIIYFDLPARSYLVPSSIYLRYNQNITSAVAALFKGIPFATPFARSEVLIGSQIVESIQQYNQLYNLLVNTKLNYGQKAGMATGFGLVDTTDAITFANLNGRTCLLNETLTVAAPLGNILSNADHLIPLGAMPSCRIQLTTDTIANMFNTVGANPLPTAFTLTNLELCFDVVDFGGDVDAMVHSMGDENGNIYIKSQSYVSANQTLAAGVSGMNELVYNMRLSSIKSLIANLGSPTSNTFFESKDVTTGHGDYQFTIAGTNYPQRPISAFINKAGAFMELMQIWGPPHDIFSNNSSIAPYEFLAVDGTIPVSLVGCGKFYIGCNVEKLSTSGALLTGLSSQLSPISFRINCGGYATQEAHLVTLIANYDALIEINLHTRQASVKQ